MAYRYDPDLEFLGKLPSEDLDDLVYCLTHDKDGETRWTEELTASNIYKRYYPDHHQYWEEIAAEIQCFGGNSFANLFRGGKGVLYREVLMDVCDKMKVNYNKETRTQKIEEQLLNKILMNALDEMTTEEITSLADELGIQHSDFATKQAGIAVIQGVFKAGGFKSYQITLIVVNAVLKAILGRGLTLAGNAMLTRTASILAGPVGWVITGLWTAIDLAGTAYRVTIPAVIQIVALRQKLSTNE